MLWFICIVIAAILAWKWTYKDGVSYTDEEIQQNNINDWEDD